jgi:competence protein ComEC
MNTRGLRKLLERWGVIGALIVAVVLLLIWLWRRRTGLLFLLVLLAVILIVVVLATPPVRRHPGTLRATILDVGKGDSIVIESPTGRVMVVDAGGLLGRNDDRAKRVIGPFLRQRGIRRIDTLLLTHPHQDHIGGAATLIDQFEVGRVVDNGVGDKSGLVERYRKVAVRRGVPVQQVARGNRLDLDRRVHVQVLHPRRAFPGTAGSINDTSIVLRVTFGRTALLLTGDAGKAVEDEMRRARQPLACDVLKVAHHGGRGATTDAFWTRPDPPPPSSLSTLIIATATPTPACCNACVITARQSGAPTRTATFWSSRTVVGCASRRAGLSRRTGDSGREQKQRPEQQTSAVPVVVFASSLPIRRL